MDEYIKREALMKSLEFVTNDTTCPIHIAAEIDQIIEQEPAADVTEVRHGEWKQEKDGHCVCSECGRTRPYNRHIDAIENWACNYCHWCGAKMDGGK